MLTLDRAVARNAQAGEALHVPWRNLSRVASPRRAQLTMIFGPSGSCKSMFALNLLLDWRVPTLYVSPDTDQHDMALRCVANRRGWTTETVESALAADAVDLTHELADLREWLRFSFDPSPTVDDLDLELCAFEEAFGAPPEVLVVDTLSDVQAGDEDEFRGFRRTMAALHEFSRTTGAAVLVLHHTTGEFDGDVAPAPRRAINGKLSKVPELILSIARNGQHLGFAVVKQRSGFSDPTAQHPVWLAVDAARSTVADPTYPTSNWSN